MHTQSRGARTRKVALVVGLLAFALGVGAAHREAANGYELSAYVNTPELFWIGVGIALTVALVAGFVYESPTDVRRVSLLLAVLAVTAVIALPLLRGYHFVGAADSLTHLGWTHELFEGTIVPTDLLYPAVHITAVFMGDVFGVEFPRAIEYVTLLFVVVYIVFVPLCVSMVTQSRRGFVVGTFVALLLLPVNNIGVHVGLHPSSQAIMFLPFVLFVMLAYLRREFDGGSVAGVSATGVLLALAGSAMVLVHPQEALSLIAVFAAIAFVQTAVSVLRPNSAIAGHRHIYPQLLVLLGVFLAWAPRHERVREGFAGVLGSLGVGSAPGGEIGTAASSLSSVGGSIESLFVKLFLGSALFALIALVVGIASITGRLDHTFPGENALNKYLTVAAVPIIAAVGILFVAAIGDHYLRYVGFTMVFVTIMAGSALSLIRAPDSVRSARGAVSVLASVFIAVVLVLSLATVHPSPFIFQANGQVTEAEYDGYAAAFDYRVEGAEFTGVRGNQERFVDAIYGPTSAAAIEFPGRSDAIPTNISDDNFERYFDETRYVAVSERDVTREVELYDGFRYSRAEFALFDERPGVNRVETTGEFRLYHYRDEAT